MTGAYTLRALVARHAKPWKDSTDVEKLDPSNDLLLAGTLDKVYDGYLMSVHPKTGNLLFSDAIDEAERARLVDDHTRLRKTPTAEQAVHLEAHYKRFLEKQAERSSRLRNVAEVWRAPAGRLSRRPPRHLPCLRESPT